jgi:nitrogen fixation-related uncharacterized protein
MQPETSPQQYSNAPVEPASLPKSEFNRKKIIYFVVVAIVAAALSGLAVWGYMSGQNDKNGKSLNAQLTTKSNKITSLQSNVKSLETQVAAKTTTTTTNSSQQATNATGMFESFVDFCGTDGSSVSYATLTDRAYSGGGSGGYFGSCSIAEKGTLTGGGLLFARYINNAWQRIYFGNGMADDSVCTQYQVPHELQMCVTK